MYLAYSLALPRYVRLGQVRVELITMGYKFCNGNSTYLTKWGRLFSIIWPTLIYKIIGYIDILHLSY